MAAEQPGSRGHAGATDPAVASGRAVCVLGGIGGEARVPWEPRLSFAPKTVFDRDTNNVADVFTF